MLISPGSLYCRVFFRVKAFDGYDISKLGKYSVALSPKIFVAKELNTPFIELKIELIF